MAILSAMLLLLALLPLAAQPALADGLLADIVDVFPDPRDTAVSRVDITFSASVTGFDLGDLSLTRDGNPISLSDATLVDPTGTGSNWVLRRLSTLTATSGTYVLTLTASGSGIQDTTGNTLTDDATETWTMVDSVAPTANIIDVIPDPRDTAVSSIDISFSESVTGFDLPDLSLTRDGGPVALTGATLSGSGSSYTLSDLSSLTASAGSYVLTLTASGSGIQDGSGNALALDASDTWSLADSTAPTADIIDVDPDPRNTSVSSIDISFSESVTGFDLDDLSLTRDGNPVALTGATLSGTGSSYTVSGLSSLTTTSGNYLLALTASGSGIQDVNGNALSADASDAWTMADSAGPTADLIDVFPDPRSTPVSRVDISFTERVTGFDLGDLSLTRDGNPASLAGATLVDPTGTGTNYILRRLSELTVAGGTYVLTLTAAGSGIQDANGNALSADATETWTMVDSAAPTADVVDITPDPRDTAVSSIDITFSESVTGFDLADLSLTRDGSPVALTGATVSGTGSSYTLSGLDSLTATNGSYVLTLTASGSGIQDDGGNALAADASDAWTMADSAAPSADIIDVTPDPRSTSVSSVAITFSESVTGFDIGDLGLTLDGNPVALTGASLSGNGSSYTLNGLSGLTGGAGSYVLTLTAGGSGIQDGAGNALSADASDAWSLVTAGLTVDIIDVFPDPRDTAVSRIDISFSTSVTGFDIGDFSLTLDGNPVVLTEARLVDPTGTGTDYILRRLSELTATSGTYVLTLAAAGSDIQDGAGNPLATDATEAWTMVDSAAPTADIVDVDPDPRNTSVGSIDITFSESVTGFDLADLNLTRDGSPVALTGATVSGTGSSYTVSGLDSLTAASGNYVLTLTASGSGIQDNVGNALAANASDAWTTDATAPTADIVDVTPDPRSTSVSSIDVTFSESVTGFDIGDVSLTLDGSPVALTGASLSGTGSSYTVSGLDSLTGSVGSYVLTLTAGGSGIQDTTGNALSGDASDTWTVVGSAGPTADIVDVTPDPRNTAVTRIDITFSESVTGFDIGDLSLTLDGNPVALTEARLVDPTGTGTNYELRRLSELTGAVGTYVLTLTAAGSGIQNTTGNALSADATESWSVIDSTAPTANIVNVAPDPRNTAVSSIDITFSESVTGLDLADLSLTRDGNPVVLAGATVSGTGSSYTLSGLDSLTGTSGNYVLMLTAAGSGIQDDSGNALAADASDAWTTDTTAPTADIVDITPDPRGTAVSSIAISFSENVTGFNLADLSLTRDGSPIALTGANLSGNGSSYTLSGLAGLTGSAGSYVLTLTASGSGIQDATGNALSADASDAWSLVDSTAPTADIVDVAPDPRSTSVSSIDISFSESVTGFDLADLSLTLDGSPVALTGATVSGTGSSYTLSGLSSLTGNAGSYVLTLTASGSGIQDDGGNALAADASDAWVVDLAVVTVAMTSAAPDPTNVSPIPVTVTFSESVTGFEASDIVTGNGTVGNLTGSGANYSFDLTPSGAGLVTANIPAGAALDADSNGNLAAAQFSRTFEVGSSSGAQLITDPSDSSKTALLVTGTSGNDNIKLNRSSGQVKVIVNGVTLGTFAPTGLLIALGEDGNDTITVESTLLAPSVLYGGNGNDSITGGGGTGILIGGSGTDSLTGGGARDIVIGGTADDTLKGTGGDDILIAGSTSFDDYTQSNVQALEAIRKEWTRTDLAYQARIDHLTGTTAGGLNGANLLKTAGPGQTVFDDTSVDRLTGGNGSDWFLLNFEGGGTIDTVTDRAGSEVRTDL